MKYMTTLSILNRKIRSFDFDPTVNFLFCVTEHDLYVINSHTFVVYGVISPPTKTPISIFNFSAALSLFVIITQQKIWIYSILTGQLVHEIESPGGDYCTGANFSYDGRYFVSIYNDGYYVQYSISQVSNQESEDQTIDIHFDKLCEDKYDHAIVSLSYSTGCELIALGFDNGKAIIRSTSPETSNQWIVEAHSKESEVFVYFNPHNSFQFMTRGIRKGDIKFFNIAKYGMKPLKRKNSSPKKKKNKANANQHNENNQIECYRHFYITGQSHIVTSSFSCDGTILFGASMKKLFAWRTDNATILNKVEFEQQIEIDSFYEIIPHLVIQQVAFIIAKSSLWIWNCLTNDLRCIAVQDNGEPLFQCGNWFRSNTAMVQTNIGSINYYSCENLQWNQQSHIVDEYNGPWSNKISETLREFKLPEMYNIMMTYEKRGLGFFSEGQIDFDLDSDSDFVSDFESDKY